MDNDYSGGMDTDSPDTPASEWMTAQELAPRIGCSMKALYARVDRGSIPGVLKLGRSLRFKRDVIEHWIASNYKAE